MAEVGIDITDEFPKPWTDEIVRAADVVITMGCGDACPLYPGNALRGLGARRPGRDGPRRRPPGPRRDPGAGRGADGLARRGAGQRLRAARTWSSRSASRRYQAHLPRFSRVTRPASTSTDMWCETVGWDRPMGSTRSQAQTSPSPAAATIESRRSRAGSASTLKTPASSSASASSRAPSPSGVQQARVARFCRHRGLRIAAAGRIIDNRRCVGRMHTSTNIDQSRPRRSRPCPVCSSPSTSPTSTPPSTSTRSCSPPSRPSASPATPTSPSPTRPSSSCSSKGGEGGTLNHLGVETENAAEVEAAEARLSGRARDHRRRRHHLLLRHQGRDLGDRPRRRQVGVVREDRRRRPAHQRGRERRRHRGHVLRPGRAPSPSPSVGRPRRHLRRPAAAAEARSVGGGPGRHRPDRSEGR